MGRHTRKYRKQERQERRKLKKEKKAQVTASAPVKAPVSTKTTNGNTPITINGYTGRRFCHNGPVEVYPNLYLGSLAESSQMAEFCDIRDYSILPDDVATQAVTKIVSALENKKKVGIFCLGGHGRTGYLACLVLGALDYADPIRYIRENYCKLAVESNEQIKQIAKKCEAPWLFDEYKEDEWGTSGLNAWLEAHQGGYNAYDYGYNYYGNYGNYGYGYNGWNFDDDLNIGKSVIDHTIDDEEGENISNLLDDGSRYYGRHTKDPLDDIDLDDFL